VDQQGNTSLMKENPKLKIKIPEIDLDENRLEIKIFSKNSKFNEDIKKVVRTKAKSYDMKLLKF
jgi:coenzyme F420-reducing hydrogenase delta subunit